MTDNFPNKSSNVATEKTIPDYLLKLVNGCSIYVKVATQYWLICAVFSVLALVGNDNSKNLSVAMPIITTIPANIFYSFVFFLIAVSSIAFSAAISQAIRSRQLINRSVKNLEEDYIFSKNIYLKDIIDSMVLPALNRVAPIVQAMQGRKQFLPEALEVSKKWRYFLSWFYFVLKSTATLIIYSLPIYALIFSFLRCERANYNLWQIPPSFYWVLLIFSLLTLSASLLMEVDYTIRALKQINAKKEKSIENLSILNKPGNTKNMKRWILFFSLVRPVLYWLLALSILIVVAIDFWLINYQEIFKGGAAFGPIVEKLCLSYISAFIFYVVVVHYKNVKDKFAIYRFIIPKLKNIILNTLNVFNQMAKSTSMSLAEKYPSEIELIEMCKKINPNKGPIIVIGPNTFVTNWIQFLNYHKDLSEKSIDDIIALSPFVDTELLRELMTIKNSEYFRKIGPIDLRVNIPSDDFLFVEAELWEYLGLVKELESFYEDNLMSYTKS
jgi:hypothetical protein